MSEKDATLRPGFTLVEVMVALVILAFGLLAMAGATGVFFTQIRAADVNVERAAAIEQAIERMRSLPFDSVKTVSEPNAKIFGGYRVWWSVNALDGNLHEVKIYTKGRGYSEKGGLSLSAVDSFSTSLARSLQ